VSKPSVLLVHNQYQQPGGEDEVARAETAMLRAHGHAVHEFRMHNSRIDHMGTADLLKATVWNTSAHRDIADTLATAGIDVAHFHNTFPLVSPAGYYAARGRRVGVVQTLHNYRLLCPNALFFRKGALCEQCLGRTVPWPSVVHGCYRGSRAATAAVAGMLTLHRAVGTYTRRVDVYIALTEFARLKFIEGGLPPEKVVVKPNFTEDPGPGRHADGNVLFVGRLTREKGLEDLLAAWRIVSERRPALRLTIVGAGPLEGLQERAQAGVEWLGWQPRERVIQVMQDAAVLVVPSRHREGFPMTIVEAFATGLPVLASRFEAMMEVVHDGYTGRLYEPANPRELAGALEAMLCDEEARRAMGRRARAEYEAKYTPARNYEQLMRIYALATEGVSGGRERSAHR
jgi:glycosyltransferase involved in cell wall biosynthesis